jgi:tetratricopeptide (TPR) repeat protein
MPTEIKSLQPPDSHHLSAAIGWLGLGNHIAANAELEKIAPKNRAYPSVLAVRFEIDANLEQWEAALDIASAIVKMVPDWPSGWIYRASSLTELNRQKEAYETLSTAAARFPSNEIILYDLACVCCALKQFDEAWRWLSKAIGAGGNEIKLRALDDPDLEPLWARIREI